VPIFAFVPEHFSDEELLVKLRESSVGLIFQSASLTEIRTLLRSLGRKAATTEQKTLLTRREREVFNALAEGKDPKEISRTLGISTETARNHLKSLYRKLGVHTRAEALLKHQRAAAPASFTKG
jgi:DNA-binding CsgD family transcriptional regulator